MYIKPIATATLLSAALIACSDDNTNTASDAIQLQPIAAFDNSGLPSTRLNTLLIDVVDPNAFTDISIATLSALAWVNSIDVNLPEDYLSSILQEEEAFMQTLACDSGSLTASKWGNTTLQSDRLEFSDCQLNQSTFSGTVLIRNDALGLCSGGPSLSLEMDTYLVNTTQIEAIEATGSFEYFQSAENCGSSAGGPPGVSNGLRADIATLSFGPLDNRVTYTDFQIQNLHQEISSSREGDEHTIELSVSIEDNTLSNDGISVIFVQPMFITSAASTSNTGTLIISASNGAAVTYTFLECAKDLASITTVSDETQTQEFDVAWTDERNVLAQLPVPVVRSRLTGEIEQVLESPYSADQSIEGC